MAAEGHNKNWERTFGELIRQVNYTQIAGNPNIPKNKKPRSPQALMPLSIDKKEDKKLSNDEIKKAEKRL